MSEWPYVLAYANDQARSTRKRQRVYGFRYSADGRWGYAVEPIHQHVRNRAYVPPDPVPEVANGADFARLMAGFPRCAQRSHVGGSKRAIPSARLAHRLARYLTDHGQPTHAYRCELPAPAIGPHMHLTTTGKKRRTRGR